MSAWMADNLPRQQAEGVSLSLSQLVAQMAVDGSQNKQEGDSENGEGALVKSCLGRFQIREPSLGELLWAFFGQLDRGISHGSRN